MEITTAVVVGVCLISAAILCAVVVGMRRGQNVKTTVDSPLITFTFESRKDDRKKTDPKEIPPARKPGDERPPA